MRRARWFEAVSVVHHAGTTNALCCPGRRASTPKASRDRCILGRTARFHQRPSCRTLIGMCGRQAGIGARSGT